MTGLKGTRLYVVLGAWTILVLGVGFWYVKMRSESPKEEVHAPFGDVRACGPTSQDEKARDLILREWFVKHEDLSTEAKDAFARNFLALPDSVRSELKRQGIRFAVDTGKKSGLECRAGSAAGDNDAAVPESCVTESKEHGRVLVVGAGNMFSAKGPPLRLTSDKVIDAAFLPAAFWLIFTRSFEADDGADLLPEDKRSNAGAMARMKAHVVEGLTLSAKEQDFYREEYGGAGVQSPAFVTRSTVLLAANLYCDKESFDRLKGAQREAVDRFMDVFGCVLGRPHFLTDDEFKAACAQTQ